MIDNLMGILMSIKTTDIIDIVVVAYLIYRLLGFIKETRAQQLFRGILLIAGSSEIWARKRSMPRCTE